MDKDSKPETPELWTEADCSESVERLYLFLDGELTEEKRFAIRSHLDHCPPCVNKFDFEAELRRVIADRCKDHIPTHLQERIAQAIAAERREEPR